MYQLSCNILFLKTLVFATPPVPRRRFDQSPKPSRQSWIKRHLQRRPQTVNVDDTSLSGKCEICHDVATT